MTVVNESQSEERHEALSVGWVDALRSYQAAQVAGKELDFELVMSAEYTNPPAHLLRAGGGDSVGYTVRVKDGALELLDGPHHDEADVCLISAYDPCALAYRLPLEDYLSWMRENRARLIEEGTIVVKGDLERITPLAQVVNMLGFYSNYTARSTPSTVTTDEATLCP